MPLFYYTTLTLLVEFQFNFVRKCYSSDQESAQIMEEGSDVLSMSDR